MPGREQGTSGAVTSGERKPETTKPVPRFGHFAAPHSPLLAMSR